MSSCHSKPATLSVELPALIQRQAKPGPTAVKSCNGQCHNCPNRSKHAQHRPHSK